MIESKINLAIITLCGALPFEDLNYYKFFNKWKRDCLRVFKINI